MRTAESVMASFTQRTMEGQVIPAWEWLTASEMLVALLGIEQDKLLALQQNYLNLKVKYLDLGKSSAEAKTRADTSDEYREMEKQKNFIERIKEFIRISKLHARLSDDESKLPK